MVIKTHRYSPSVRLYSGTHKYQENIQVIKKKKSMVGSAGFEPATCRLGGGRSIQLSYEPFE